MANLDSLFADIGANPAGGGSNLDALFSDIGSRPAPDVTPATAGGPARITVRPQGFVENATAPITGIPQTYSDIVRNALTSMSGGLEQARSGVASYGGENGGLEQAISGIQQGRDINYAVERAAEEAPPKPQGTITDRLKSIGNILGGIGKTAAGAAEYVSAPVVAPFRSIVSQPVENVTGLPKEYTEFAASLAAPLPKAIPGVARAPDTFMPGVISKAPQLARAVTRDQTPPAQLEQQLADTQAFRPGATLPDVAGENVRGLVETMAQTPGAPRERIVSALTARQEQQASRLATDLASLTGNRQTALEAVTNTMAERKAAATPLYKAAYTAGDKAIWSPELERLSGAPSVTAALRGAQAKWKDFQVIDGFGAANPPFQVERGGILQSTGGGGMPTYPNLQFWDYAARELRDKATEAYRAGKSELYRRYGGLERQLTAELDRIVPEYASARSAWSGPSRYLDAVEEGKNISSPKVGADEVRARLANISTAEREAYVTGAVSSILSKFGNDPARLADMTKYLRSAQMREKVAALMPSPEAASQWQKRLNYEVRSSELTGMALGNSRTAIRLAQKEDASGLAADLIETAVGHGLNMGLLRSFVGAMKGKARAAFKAGADQQLAELLTDADAARVRAVLNSKGGARLAAPIEEWSRASQNAQVSPSPQTIARLTLASRNLSTNLRDAGVNLAPDRLIRFESMAPARAEDNQQ